MISIFSPILCRSQLTCCYLLFCLSLMNDQFDKCYWFKSIHIYFRKSAHVPANARLSIQLRCVRMPKIAYQTLQYTTHTITRKQKEKWLYRKQQNREREREQKTKAKHKNGSMKKKSLTITQVQRIIFVLTQQFTHYYWSWLAWNVLKDGLLWVVCIQSHLTKSNHFTSLHFTSIELLNRMTEWKRFWMDVCVCVYLHI